MMTTTTKECDWAEEVGKSACGAIEEMVAALQVGYDRLKKLREERVGDEISGGDAWDIAFPQEAKELAELEENVGDCESEEDARQALARQLAEKVAECLIRQTLDFDTLAGEFASLLPDMLSPADKAALASHARIQAEWTREGAQGADRTLEFLQVCNTELATKPVEPVHSEACLPESDPSGKTGPFSERDQMGGPAPCPKCHTGELTLLDGGLLARCGCCGAGVRVSVAAAIGGQEGPS